MNTDIHTNVLTSVLEGEQASNEQGPRVVRADIRSISQAGTIEVVPSDDSSGPFVCDVLESAFAGGVQLEVGDIVLALTPGSPTEPGCILGRIGSYRLQQEPAVSSQQQAAKPVPDKLVIEAGEELVIKCGDASLDLRKDGKLMIRGKDVLSRAKRVQRIKGGSVAIN